MARTQEDRSMCSSPNIPPPPPPPQAIKLPDQVQSTESMKRNRASAAVGGGSLLTGPSGIATASAVTGKTSLLGG
jgi:hypothetical protein